MSKYELKPEIEIAGNFSGSHGYDEILKEVADFLEGISSEKKILAIEGYPGVNWSEVKESLIKPLGAETVIYADDFAQSIDEVQNRIKDVITEDRVFGILSHYTIDQFYMNEKINEAKELIANAEGLVIVYGFGTNVLAKADCLIYADLARWEIQKRFRYEGLTNWKIANAEEDALRKFKRGYFFEWRMADRQKNKCFGQIDFLLDTNNKNKPTMIDGSSYRAGVEQASKKPFRLVPYFDASVWGGHWMEEHFSLPSNGTNYGWAFDGVPEENIVILNFSGTKIEIPAINLVFQHPNNLLGKKVHARFGTEFPIRFDYLDTMGGGNLSLQVHPLVEYAQDKFGIHYTQNESYYILESTEKSTIYLGVKDGTNRDELVAELKKATDGDYRFPDEDFINVFPVKKHDHISIPAGTIHCGGPDTVVLEISATPYIFTFKLWDWERVGLDGVPRPVHLAHGEPNLLMNVDKTFCEEQLINRVDEAHGNLSSQAGVKTEITGLHELEFIETHRHWFKDSVNVCTHDSVNMLNLVEGESIAVESLDGSFAPFVVNYGETFIVPANIEKYIIKNTGNKENEIAVIQAFVKNL